MKIFRDILTGADNTTYDQGRVLCLLSHIVYYVMAGVGYAIEKPWAPMDFASGIGTMVVAFGVHLYLKKDTEPSSQ